MKPRINLAALAALAGQDMENFLVAATPGGIEAQGAAGQQQFVNSSTLPKERLGCTREQIEAMGVAFGDDADELFVNVTLPEGWAKVPTDHHMWSDLRDASGRVRANIFYKAAFYDRRAHINLCRYVNVTRRWYDETEETDAAVVNGDGAILFETPRMSRDDYQAIDKAEATAQTWADANYPDWRNPLAYWPA